MTIATLIAAATHTAPTRTMMGIFDLPDAFAAGAARAAAAEARGRGPEPADLPPEPTEPGTLPGADGAAAGSPFFEDTGGGGPEG
jgi:hypothetical protein